MRRSSKIQCGSVEVPFNVEGDKDFTDSLISHQFWGRYVVGGVVPSDTAGDKTIVQSRELTYNENTINCDSGHLFHGIKYVAHHAEATRQEQGQYTVHGNVIELGGVALALIGGISGIGKTTVSSCAQEAGWTWMSDEKFALEETGEYVQGLGQILDDEKTRSAAVGRTPDGYSHSIPIGAFVIPIVTGEATPTIHRYDSGKAMYHYYEELGRNITAGRALMSDYPAPLPSIDTPRLAAKRAGVAERLAAKIPMVFIRGNEQDILDQCGNIIDG